MRLPWVERQRRQREMERARETRLLAYTRVVEALSTRLLSEINDEDTGWHRLADRPEDRDLTQQEREMAVRRSLEVWMKDPSMGTASLLLQSGTFGTGVTAPRANDEVVQLVIDRFWDDPDNKVYLTGRDAQIRLNLELMIFGEKFATVHVSDVDSTVKIAAIDQNEITNVIPHPEKSLRPLLYERRFRRSVYNFVSRAQEPGPVLETEYYLDWRYLTEPIDDAAMEVLQRIPEGQLRTDAFVYHVKVNSLGRRGIPEILRAIDWVEAHHTSLSDLATWSKAAAMIAWEMKMDTKSQTALDNAARMFQEPVPGVGAVHGSGRGTTMTPVSQPGGEQNLENTSRAMHLQSIRAFGFGEHWYSDATKGSLATASAMELPAIWRILDRQETVKAPYIDLVALAITRARDLRDLTATYGFTSTVEIEQDTDTYFDIEFPPAAPAQQASQAQALSSLSFLIDPKEAASLAYRILGSNDVDELLARQFSPEAQAEAAAAAAGQAGEQTPFESALVEAVQEAMKRDLDAELDGSED